MARLNAAARRRVPKSQMGVPSKAKKGKGAVSGTFPMPDKKHARAAIMLSGKAPASERPAIIAKARRILGRASRRAEKQR